MSLLDDTRQLAATLPADGATDYHETQALLGALFVVLETAGIEVPAELVEQSREAQMQALVATGPRPAFDASTAAKLSQVDELIVKLQDMLAAGGQQAPPAAQPPAAEPSSESGGSEPRGRQRGGGA